MKYDFTTRVSRTGRGNLKDLMFTPSAIRQHNLPSFSGAEFEFRTAQPVIDAMKECAENGLMGFTIADQNYRDHIVWWLKNIRKTDISPDWILPMQGTIFSVASAIRLFVKPEEHMVLMTPDYNRYDQAARRLKRGTTIFSPMIEKEGRFHPDFEDLERKFSDPKAKLFVLCNPDNPTGQVLSEEELHQLLSLARKYRMPILSDEIFADIPLNGKTVPLLTALAKDSDLVISILSMGKTFSFTGVNHANAIIRNPGLYRAFEEQRTADHFGSIDPMAYAALIGGYTPAGAEWLSQLIEVLKRNTDRFLNFFSSFEGVKAYTPDAGYVLWADLSALGMEPDALFRMLEEEALFACDRGEEYYGGKCCARICTAVMETEVIAAIGRLEKVFAAHGFRRKEE